MQFLLMCCFDEARWAELAEERRAQVMHAYAEWVREQTAAGRYVTGGKLDDSRGATTVRMRDGRAQLTDGPFSEAREQIGGYHLIDCVDAEEALAIAQTVPTLPVGGSVEVRPLLHRLGD